MNKSNVNGDSIIVCGTPIPDTKGRANIPPKTAGKKIIQAGEIEIKLESNTAELINKLNKNKGNKGQGR